MEKEISKKLDRVSKPSLSEKQSARTTFKLSESCTSAIDWLIKRNNLKPKEVFDLMCSDETLIKIAIEAAKSNGKNGSTKQIRKTFVISNRVLRLLNEYSKNYKLSRDLIVEKLILLFKVLLEQLAKREKQQERKALKILSDLEEKAESVEEQLKDLLDNDSPILYRFADVGTVLMKLTDDIESKLSDDVPIKM